jgi:hypothetical protein
MGENRFKEYRKLVAKIWETKDNKDTDVWWGFSSAVDEFNEQHKRLVRPSNWIVADESMSPWCPRKSKTGGQVDCRTYLKLFESQNHWVRLLLLIFA